MNDFSLLTPDGTNFQPNDKEIDLIVTNNTIDGFIQSGRDSSKSLIVGQKGSGKSIFISYKSYRDRKETSEKKLNKFFIPEQGVEKIQLDNQLSSNDLVKNTKYTDWEKIFNVTIYYFLLAKLRKQFIDNEVISESDFNKIAFHKLFNKYGLDSTKTSFGSILSKCIKNRGIIYKNQGDFIGTAKHIIRIYLATKEVVVYLDNLDQTLFQKLQIDQGGNFESIVGPLKEKDLKKFINSPSYKFADNPVKVWLSCHVGYFLAIYNINEIDRNLNVFSTFRLEAFEHLRYISIKNQPQLRSIVCAIEYSDNDFHKIFRKLLSAANISETELQETGLNILPHTWVSNSFLNKESLWSFIKRHTFNNPREITFQVMTLQKVIETVKKSNLKNSGEIALSFKRSISIEALTNIISDLQKETLPFFPLHEFASFYMKNKRNWIKREEVKENDKNLLVILYRLGLLGVIHRDGKNNYVQKFLKKNVYFINEKIVLPESSYYLFHPTLDHILLAKFPTHDFYYPHCIIGDCLRFSYLREIEYYLPIIKKNNGNTDPFIDFYNTKKQVEKYNLIQESIKSKWSSLIWDYALIEKSQDWINYLAEEITNDEQFFHARRRNIQKNRAFIPRNYKLRIVICFSALAGLLPNHQKLTQLFRQGGNFSEITYFLNIRGNDNKLERYLKGLSPFEMDTIETCLSQPNFSEKLLLKLKFDSKLKEKAAELTTRMKNALLAYK